MAHLLRLLDHHRGARWAAGMNLSNVRAELLTRTPQWSASLTEIVLLIRHRGTGIREANTLAGEGCWGKDLDLLPPFESVS